MRSKRLGIAAVVAALICTPAWSADSSEGTPEEAALSQCVALRTTGADRILTARWLFAVMSNSPQMGDLSAVTPERRKELDQGFAKLVTRLVTKDCVEQVRPVAIAKTFDDAVGEVGGALGETAMGELMNGKEVNEAINEYGQFFSDDDFKQLIDTLPKKQK